MTTNHIDQLTQWWEAAEQGAVQKGDIVIERVEDGQYNVFTAFESEARILYRTRHCLDYAQGLVYQQKQIYRSRIG